MDGLTQLERIVSVSRDIAVVIGLPAVTAIAVFLYMRHVDLLRQHIANLESLTYSSLLNEMKAQEEIFERQKERLSEQIRDLEDHSNGQHRQLASLQEELARVSAELESVRKGRQLLAPPPREPSPDPIRIREASREEIHRFFQQRLFPKALRRAQKDYSYVQLYDENPVAVINERALQLARDEAVRLGVGQEWEKWVGLKSKGASA